MATSAEPGWYDDGTGVLRWWDGARWTEDYADLRGPSVELRSDAAAPGQTQAIGAEDRFGGFTVEGRWIQCGAMGQPIGGVVAVVGAAGELAKRPAVAAAVRARTIFTPIGPMTPRQFHRFDRRALLLVIEGPGPLWVTPVSASDEARARRFATWVNRSSDHYRYG